jgi:hypothetical protein
VQGVTKAGSAQDQVDNQPLAHGFPGAQTDGCSFAGNRIIKDIAACEHSYSSSHRLAMRSCMTNLRTRFVLSAVNQHEGVAERTKIQRGIS